MTVLINGLGNIGITTLNLLVEYKTLLNIYKIYALKNIPKTWEKHQYNDLSSKGICIISWDELDKVKNEINFVFDTTSNGIGTKNKETYLSFKNLIGAVAQGSEDNFGTPYMAGLNDSVIMDSKFITVVSCNTHGILSVIQYYSNGNFDKVESADFVIVRRSEDIGNHERLVTANVIARNRSEFGTHHGTDADKILKTIGKNINIFSSDITTPSQLMHGLRFNLVLKNKIQINQPHSFLISETEFFDSNKIFELGRRYGFQGRLYSHSIIVANNIVIRNNRVIGWAFVPQEGNTILSTIKAFLIKTNPTDYEDLFKMISNDLYLKKI